jgi:hypothetical protein
MIQSMPFSSVSSSLSFTSFRLRLHGASCSYHCCPLPCFGCWLRAFSEQLAQELAFELRVLPQVL